MPGIRRLSSSAGRAAAWALVAALLVGVAARARGESDPRLRLIDGAGFDDPDNVGASRAAAVGDELYVGTWNSRHGAKLYRSSDLKKWRLINTPGFGNPNSFTIQFIIAFHDRVYISVWNRVDGGEVYRADPKLPDEKMEWEKVVTGGFDDRNNQACTHMCVFKDHLYAGCFNPKTGPEVWRTATGDVGEWAQVNQDAWNHEANSDATFMLVHDGYLYVGTESAHAYNRIGCELWRTTGDLAPPYDQWELVNKDGFGNPRNHNICGLVFKDGKIYAATWNWSQGIEIWRATPTKEVPFADWERVVEKGLGDHATVTTSCMTMIDGTIYLGSIGQYGLSGSLFAPGTKLLRAHGASLIKSDDGTNWERLGDPDFMQFPMLGIIWIAPFKGKLYVCGQALDRPFQLWEFDPKAEPKK